MKKIAVIPTLLTLGNGVCGFAAIAYASKMDGTEATQHFFALSGWLILAAMVFDALDGYLARISRTSSKFGGELDSLCDAVSFGVAPAFLVLRMGPGWEPRPMLHQVLAGIAALYMVCAILRLARFNVQTSLDANGGSKRFKGLPSPGAAGCLASLAILRGGHMDRGLAVDPATLRAVLEVWTTLGALLMALLMVSRVPYPHMTKQILRGRRHFSHLVQIILAGFIVYLAHELVLVLLFWVYALAFPLRYQMARRLRSETRPAPAVVDKGFHP